MPSGANPTLSAIPWLSSTYQSSVNRGQSFLPTSRGCLEPQT